MSVLQSTTVFTQHMSSIFDELIAAHSGVPRGRGGLDSSTPPEIPKALQNRAKLTPTVKTVKNCWIQDANSPRCSVKRQ